jgi:hypothetical protein
MAARLGARVQLTDHAPEVLRLAQRNAASNGAGGAVQVLQLDWMRFLFVPHTAASLEGLAELLGAAQPQQPGSGGHGAAAQPAAARGKPQQAAEQQHGFGWTPEALQQLLRTQVLLAADTVYDEGLTEAFLSCAAYIMACIRLARRRAPAGAAADAGAASAASAEPGSAPASAEQGEAGGDPVLLLAMEKRFNFTREGVRGAGACL